MAHLQGIFFFDVSAVIFMIVLAYLSKRLGEALKIQPYYKGLYISVIMIISASVLDVLSGAMTIPFIIRVSLLIRFISGVVAGCVVLRYWGWVFAEFFKH